MSSNASRWRAPAIGAATGLLVAAAIVGPSAVASSGGNAAAAPAPKAATVACPAAELKARTGESNDASGGPGPGPFLAAVAQLVQAGTIDSAQARVIDADIRAGSIDPDQIVASRTLSSSQMQAVSDRLSAVKQSLGSASQNSGPGHGKAPQG